MIQLILLILAVAIVFFFVGSIIGHEIGSIQGKKKVQELEHELEKMPE